MEWRQEGVCAAAFSVCETAYILACWCKCFYKMYGSAGGSGEEHAGAEASGWISEVSRRGFGRRWRAGAGGDWAALWDRGVGVGGSERAPISSRRAG
jgi:hypothetical protein